MTRFNKRNNPGFALPEVLFAALVAFALLLILLPSVRQNREAARTAKQTGTAATIARIEHAKALYAADNRLKPGDTVTISELVHAKYLASAPDVPGIRFGTGAVGTPVNYAFVEARQKERADDHAHDARGTDVSP